jgi:drug/metabolite transporter (DMT)-like permease
MELHRPSGRASLGFAFAFLTMAAWGVLPLALELVLQSLDTATITWFRFLVSALLLGLFLAQRRALPDLRGLGRSGWILLAAATFGLAANYIAYLEGLDRTTPANAQVLIQTAPLLLSLGGILVFRERFSPGQWLGFTVLVAGLGLFFAAQLRALAGEAQRYLSGVAMLGLAAITWAAYGLAQKQLLRRLRAQAIMVCVYAGCVVCFWPWAHPSALASLGALPLALLLFCAVNTLVAYGAFASALEHWEASRVSAVIALTPLATLAFSSLAAGLWPARFTAEALSPPSFAGAALVVGGSLLVALGGHR